MKYALILLTLSGCGYSAMNSEMIGQVKSIVSVTPLLCSNRTDVDLSLGVMVNGIGSMSSSDVYATVTSLYALTVLKAANEKGTLVKVKYNVRRFTWCENAIEITEAELIK